MSTEPWQLHFASSVSLRTAGALELVGLVSSHLRIDASTVHVAGDVTSGSVVAPSADMAIAGSILGSERTPVRIRTGSLQVEGEARHAKLEANQLVAVARLDRSHVVVANPHGASIRIGATDPHPLPSIEPQTAPEWPLDKRYDAAPLCTDSTIEAAGLADIAIQGLRDSTVTTDGRLLVDGHIELGHRHQIAAQSIWSNNLTASDASGISARELAIFGFLKADGQLQPDTLYLGDGGEPQSAGGRTLTISVHGVRAMGQLQRLTIDSAEWCHIEVTASDSSFAVSGQARLVVEQCTVKLRDGATCTVAGHVAFLAVDDYASAALHRERGTDLTVDQGEIRGDLTLHDDGALELVVLKEPKLSWYIASVRSTNEAGITTVHKLEALGGTSIAIRSSRRHGARVAMTGKKYSVESIYQQDATDCSVVAIDNRGHGQSTFEGLELWGWLDVQLYGTFSKLLAAGSGPDELPTLHLNDRSSIVSNAEGELRIGNVFEGRLHGAELVLKGVDPQNSTRSHHGRLMGFDPSDLPYGDLENLRAIGVVDPDPNSIVAYATGMWPGDDLDSRIEMRERAEKMTKLYSVITEGAISGRSRSSLRWAIARLHHRSLAPGFEYAARTLHRMVGYSQRPEPALWTLIGVWLSMFALGFAFDDGSMHGRVSRTAEHTLMLPFAFLRLSDPVRLFACPVVNLAAVSVSTLALLFVIIAIRNYMRTPGE